MDERVLYVAGGVIIGALMGAGGTYLALQRKYQVEFDEALDRELEATKKFYATLVKPDSPEEMARDLGVKTEEVENYEELADAYSGEKEEDEEVQAELKEVSANVFTNYANTDTWDADKEEAERDTSKPYIISFDEFFENAPDHVQDQLTYFSEDGVLADSTDKPVDESIVGEEHLDVKMFGRGSRDPNILYIRNEQMDLDLEISYAEGKYSEQVMGFIQHGEPQGRRAIRKFRLDDE